MTGDATRSSWHISNTCLPAPSSCNWKSRNSVNNYRSVRDIQVHAVCYGYLWTFSNISGHNYIFWDTLTLLHISGHHILLVIRFWRPLDAWDSEFQILSDAFRYIRTSLDTFWHLLDRFKHYTYSYILDTSYLTLLAIIWDFRKPVQFFQTSPITSRHLFTATYYLPNIAGNIIGIIKQHQTFLTQPQTSPNIVIHFL